MSAPSFDGDRGKNNLAHNNERELIPFFLEDKDGNLNVNDNLVAGSGGQGKKGGKNANIAAAKANKPTAVRPFAVGQKQSPQTAVPQPKAKPKVAAQAAAGKWAGGAFLNSPPPSSLPMPRFMGGMESALLSDPAIVSSSSNGAVPVPRGGIDAAPHSARQGSRVLAKFTDGLWYEGTVMIRRGDDLDIVFDGYEMEGVYPVPAHDVTLLELEKQPKDHQLQMQERQRQLGMQHQTLNQQQHSLPPRPSQPPMAARPTSIEELEKQLLSTSFTSTHMSASSPMHIPAVSSIYHPSPSLLTSMATPHLSNNHTVTPPSPIAPTERPQPVSSSPLTSPGFLNPPQNLSLHPNTTTHPNTNANTRPFALPSHAAHTAMHAHNHVTPPSNSSTPPTGVSPMFAPGLQKEIVMAPFPYPDASNPSAGLPHSISLSPSAITGTPPTNPALGSAAQILSSLHQIMSAPPPSASAAAPHHINPPKHITATELEKGSGLPGTSKLPVRRPASGLLASAISGGAL